MSTEADVFNITTKYCIHSLEHHKNPVKSRGESGGRMETRSDVMLEGHTKKIASKTTRDRSIAGVKARRKTTKECFKTI